MANTDTENERPSGNHNERLKEVLQHIEVQVSNSRSDNDLVKAISLLDHFPEPVRYDNSFLNKVCILIGVIILPATAFLFHPGLQSMEYGLTAMGGILLTWLINFLWKRHRKGSFTNLSDAIHSKSSLLDYGLTEQQFNARQKVSDLQRQFGSFKQGNYENKIKRIVTGTYTGTEHSFSYEYFHYHYVDRHTETYTTTDKDGRTTTHTRTVYKHFDRYGFILPFPYTRGVRVSESRFNWFSSSWKTSSIDFNKKFNIQTENEMVVAKFLKPKILTEIEKAAEFLGALDLNFNTAGTLCFSFNNSNTLTGHRRTGLETPAAFKQEIAEHNDLKALDTALEFLHRLMKYSDNNFEKS